MKPRYWSYIFNQSTWVPEFHVFDKMNRTAKWLFFENDPVTIDFHLIDLIFNTSNNII